MSEITSTNTLYFNAATFDLNGSVHVPAIVSMQGSRLTYQSNFMFRQITNYFDYTDVKPDEKNGAVDNIDIQALRNRYLRLDKVKDLVEYISSNIDSYILPPISAVSFNAIPFFPYNQQEIINRMGSEYNLARNPEQIEAVLKEFNGLLQGQLILRESDLEVEILDGNHRVASIHQLITMGKEFKNLRIGVQIFVEKDLNKQRQAFVDMNTSTPIDKTILTLFSNRDPLAVAAKETIGKNPDFQISEFISDSPDYIGFDAINDSVTRNSKVVLSLNMVKNMLVRFSLGESGTPKKFETLIANYSNEEYENLLKDFKKYMQAIFNYVEPFGFIKSRGTKVIPKYRELYISLTGAGLYIIASIGHSARTRNEDLELTAKKLAKIDWKREKLNENGEKVANDLFRSGILSESGNVSNTRTALNSTLTAINDIIISDNFY